MNLIYQSLKSREPRKHFFRLLSLKTVIIGVMMGLMANTWIIVIAGLIVFLLQFVIPTITIKCPTCFAQNNVEHQVAIFNCPKCGSGLGLNNQNVWVPASEINASTASKTKVRQRITRDSYS
ncbi:hypothetical protein [Pelotomaculum propionicicum]|uniref:Uncharacterized protein n=1 Tax=Pelotomaculum propionicicum TaxID=258475 RepID=A0A4Y7RQZ1_9FIRM|nr:hypothetical protein [Pelotomaculum propionicicum]TEB11273.1 hypothetical protein Pmgp_01808 [Pelotomaculum propionicicum]